MSLYRLQERPSKWFCMASACAIATRLARTGLVPERLIVTAQPAAHRPPHNLDDQRGQQSL